MSENYLDELIERYPRLASSRADIQRAYEVMRECFAKDHKLLVAGNGGSAADAEHIVGELMKHFCRSRAVSPELAQRLMEIDPERGAYLAAHLERGLMAIPLTTHEALSTAYMNDVDGLGVFAQQLYGYGREGDVFLAISTSGNSKNILYAAVAARALGIPVIGLTGGTGGKLAAYTDVCICVDEKETYKIQELHLPIYHCLCLMLEDAFFGQEEAL